MTKKDYVLIAHAMAAARYRPGSPPKPQHQVFSETLADALARDNPRFDRDRFLAACGVQS